VDRLTRQQTRTAHDVDDLRLEVREGLAALGQEHKALSAELKRERDWATELDARGLPP
jgi:hypothetical protein